MTTIDIRTGRFSQEQLSANFSDYHPPLKSGNAIVEANRCYFCYDAPCVDACPTAIDIPNFIRKISTGNLKGSAKDILSQNIMGGMCARVCPTEVLCEASCVRETQEHQPVRIGDLQRYVTDRFFETGETFFERGEPTGKRIAIVGGGHHQQSQFVCQSAPLFQKMFPRFQKTYQSRSAANHQYVPADVPEFP